MTYPTAESIIQTFSATHRIIQRQTDGLTHTDSLLQLPFRGNCLNWVLGHILVGRNRALRLLGQTAIWNESAVDRYVTGSEPITRHEQALPLEALLSDLDRSQKRIAIALEQVWSGALATTVEAGGSERPLGQILAGLAWHETYHTGQLELLRQLAGKNDAII